MKSNNFKLKLTNQSMVKKLIINFLIENGTRIGKSIFKAYTEVVKK